MDGPILNPRFVAYARAHGREPADQLEQDRVSWPGGSMCGFVMWNNNRLHEARRAIPHAFCYGGLVSHDAYDAWLEHRVDEILAERGS